MTAEMAKRPAITEITEITVWDRFVRVAHWGLAGLVAVAAITGFLMGPRQTPLHVWAGSAAAALVAARLVWGVLGPTHARISGFLRGPRAVVAQARATLGAPGPRYLGHNPLGALMVVALWAVVAALAVTGVVALGGVLKAGPLGFAPSFATGWAVREIHQSLAIALLVLIALHLAGVVVESWRERESLVRAMVTGRKSARAGDVSAPPRAPRLRAALTIGAGLGAVALATGLGLSALPVPGLPVAPAAFLPAYAAECGDCHAAFNPSLLPAASWTALMQGLDHHFGEDASLDPATRAAIAGWLTAHAAESADTLAANRMLRVDPEHPFQITATRFWTRMHRAIPDATFAAKPVFSRANCAACHADAAAGLFRPSSIAIPEEAEK